MEEVKIPKNHINFFISIIFGCDGYDAYDKKEGYQEKAVNVSIKTAYRDVCRTIREFSTADDHDKIKEEAIGILTEKITQLGNCKEPDKFDKWHKECCEQLINEFKYTSKGEDKKTLYYGQAQKWINMSLKYLSILNYDAVKEIYPYLHVPMDSYIMKATEENKSINAITTCWSKIDSYDKYMKWQTDFRKQCKKNKEEGGYYTEDNKGIPLIVESELWLEQKRKEEKI